MQVTQEKFGTINDRNITAFMITNENGMKMTCIDYGCVITKIITPDKNGNLENIVLGFDSLDDYQRYSPYFGAVVGRVAGRIKGAEFELNGKSYQLTKNEGEHHLHGGDEGFSHVRWDAVAHANETEGSVEFTYRSLDGAEGYPGNLALKVTYSLTNDNELLISYSGNSDETTLVNLTNHTYFNLSGNIKDDIQEHVLTMDSERFLEIGKEMLPTGRVLSVEKTPFDFRGGKPIFEGINSVHEQNRLVGNGFDHPFLLDSNHQKEIVLQDAKSGRVLTVETDEPSVVLYTGNKLGNDYQMRGVQARDYLGLCLETQGPPDSIHHPAFSSAILKRGEKYQTTTKYSFTTTNDQDH